MTHLQFRANRATGWNQLKLGAGGWVTGIDIASDGTMVCRGDVFGAWRWNGTKWVQLITDASMPDEVLGQAMGCYEIRIAPSNTAIFYMMHGGYVYKTTNSGTSWTQTTFSRYSDTDGHYGANDGYRTYGPKLAVSPSDPNHVIAGTPSGSVYRTTDGGSNWSAISGITAPTSEHGYRIIFISSSEILIASDGTGVYRSTDSGANFSITSSGPTLVYRWDLAADGAVWATGSGSTKNIWKFASGSWTSITNGADAQWLGIVCDPEDANYVLVSGGGFSNIEITTDAASTWSGQIFYNYPDSNQISIGDTSSDIPWIGNVGEHYLSEGNMKFHPITGKLYLGMGIGVLYCDRPSASPIVFSSKSVGLEGMVANWVISPPGGFPILCNYDRPLWRITNPAIYPSGYGPNYDNPVIHCFGADYASSDPTFIAAIVSNSGIQESGYSTNGGTTWTNFAAVPTQAGSGGKLGGHIAVSTPANMVWVPSNNANPSYTTDGGTSWTELAISGVPTTGETGWSYAYYNNSHCVCADRVSANTFYLANYIVPGIYRSTDSGANWTKMNGASLGWLVGGQILAIPGHAGHLILSNGPYSATTLKKSTDGGANWSDVGSVTQSIAFGFGKQIGSGDDPTYFMIGYVSGVYGIWYSVDSGANWTSIGTYPLGIYASAYAISGDMNTAGVCYVGLGGYAWVYYNP